MNSRPIAPITTAGPFPRTQASSSTQPASAAKALDNLEDDFALHVPIVAGQAATATRPTRSSGNILKEINEKLSSGFGTYRDAVAVAGNAKDLTGPAADFVTFKFMRDIADSIHDKYGVTPILGNIQQFKSESQLGEIEGIGAAQVPSDRISP